MSKGLGQKQLQLLQLLEKSNEVIEGDKIVWYSHALKELDIHQSALSRALKVLHEKQMIKVVTFSNVEVESVFLPMRGENRKTKICKNSAVGKKTKGFTYFNSKLPEHINNVISESTVELTEHEELLKAISRLRGVNFVKENIVKTKSTYGIGDRDFFHFNLKPQRFSVDKGVVIGEAIPLKYIGLESGLPNHKIKKLLDELRQSGHVQLVYSHDSGRRNNLQNTIGVI